MNPDFPDTLHQLELTRKCLFFLKPTKQNYCLKEVLFSIFTASRQLISMHIRRQQNKILLENRKVVENFHLGLDEEMALVDN